jgi:hypothetical protein
MHIHLTAIAFCTLLGANALHAQEPAKQRDPAKMIERSQERAEERTAELVSQLGLNEDQAQRVAVINNDFVKVMTDVRSAGLDEAARREKMKGLRQQREADLKAVLTEAQYTKLLELRKEKRAEKEAHKGQHHGKGAQRGPAMKKPTAQ